MIVCTGFLDLKCSLLLPIFTFAKEKLSSWFINIPNKYCTSMCSEKFWVMKDVLLNCGWSANIVQKWSQAWRAVFKWWPYICCYVRFATLSAPCTAPQPGQGGISAVDVWCVFCPPNFIISIGLEGLWIIFLLCH